MLNQETQDTTTEQTPPTVSVAQARVTPDELASALAAIEARRQAEAARLAGTIPIEEAVSGLHLDSTPDEIWAEVQAQRAKAEAAQNQSVHPSFAAADAARREQLRQTQVAQQARQRTQAIKPRNRSRRGWPFGLIGPAIAFFVLFQTGVFHRPSISFHTTPPAAHVAKISTLAQVPDGQEVYADSQTLVQISEGTPLTEITVDQNSMDNGWRMLKIGGHVYMRGYILNTNSFTPLQGKSLNVYNGDNSGELEGEKTSQVTVRVDKVPLQKSGGDSDYSEVTIANFQPDPLTTLNEWR